MKLKPGQKAPAFSLPDAAGKKVKLSDFLGKPVVLYFYPRDDTPGCTKEACSFRDNLPKFFGIVIGISMDSPESHRKFSEKYKLPFILLSDITGAVCKKYDVYGLKSLYGRKFFGIKRTTFLIDEKGKIKHIFENVKPEGHAGEVLKHL